MYFLFFFFFFFCFFPFAKLHLNGSHGIICQSEGNGAETEGWVLGFLGRRTHYSNYIEIVMLIL